MSIAGNRQALGRGLGALIPSRGGTPPESEHNEPAANDADTAGPPDGPAEHRPPEGAGPSTPEGTAAADGTAIGTSTVAIAASIRANPDQPRTVMDGELLEELAQSIRDHGVLQPVLVLRAPDGGYTLVAGERRWRAAQLAGLEAIPAVVTDLDDADVLTVALVENLQRADLSPLEEAQAYRSLADRFQMTQEQIAQRVGKSRTAVANALRLLQLPKPIRDSLAATEISEGHARAILGAPPEQQMGLWEYTKNRALSVRQVEQTARTLREDATRAATPAPSPVARRLPGDVLAQERLQGALGTRVEVRRRQRRGGKIVIQWYDDEQLEAIVARIANAMQPDAEPLPDHLIV